MKYDRAKGSKRDQGIKTAKKDRVYKCGCIFKHNPELGVYEFKHQGAVIGCASHVNLSHSDFLKEIQKKKSKVKGILEKIKGMKMVDTKKFLKGQTK